MNKINKINVGVIGLGVGEAHINSYQSIPEVEVLSICDLNKSRLKEIGDKYNIPNRYDCSKKITEDAKIDLVSICSYDNFHASQVISAFRNGKHVMVEKPFVLFKHEAEEVILEWEKSKCRITSNLILRQSPRFINLKKMIDQRKFGEIYHIEGDYIHQILHKILEGWRGKLPFYCTVYGGGIHLIDLMRWLIKDEVKEVCAMGNNILTKQSQYKYPETISALFKYKNGATGKSTTTFGPQRTKFHSLNVYGTKKTFINHNSNGEIFSGDTADKVHQDIFPYPGFLKGDLLPDFIQSIRNNKEQIISAKDIFRVMDVCFAVWESLEKKKSVDVSYIL